jgi:hypothetical protein
MQMIINVRHTVLFVLALLGIATPAVAQTFQWSSVGGGTNFVATALKVFNDGAGPALYVGGAFTTTGGVLANRIAKWDGTPVVGSRQRHEQHCVRVDGVR